MKSTFLLLGFLLFAPIIVRAQSNDPVYSVVDRGLDYRVWAATNSDGSIANQYTELSPGMHFTNSSGQWVESVEQINLLSAGGASATQGRHQVYFPGDIYTGVIQVVTPDGRILSHRPVGVSYDDGSNCVWIAKLQDCQGYLTDSNKVAYPNAFTGVQADLICTYRRGGFENDLVFRQQPPSPEAYGLDPSASTLQLFTEFFDTQDPTPILSGEDPDFGITDTLLQFGKLTMAQGKAFIVGNETTNTLRVYKSWYHVNGRTFLLEQVPLDYIKVDLETLPQSTNILTSQVTRDPILFYAQSKRIFPPAREVVKDTNQILTASMDFKSKPGVVLDYSTIVSGQTNFTFIGTNTYLIRGTPQFSGVTTIQGGAVLKFDHDYGNGSGLILTGTISCTPGNFRTAYLTDLNDNSVGQTITNSSGYPSGGNTELIYAYNLSSPPTPWQLNNLSISYGLSGFWADDNNDVVVRNCQFNNFGNFAVEASGGNVYITNALFQNCIGGDAVGANGTVQAQNVTSISSYFSEYAVSLSLKDSIFDTSSWIGQTCTTNHCAFGVSSSAFQTGPLGAYYLSTNSTNLIHTGSTNAGALGLYHYTVTTNQVKEATNIVSLGFHYIALDNNGNPLDTNGDGIPDFIQDVNGNGITDGSETSWIISSYNGLSSSLGLSVFTPLK